MREYLTYLSWALPQLIQQNLEINWSIIRFFLDSVKGKEQWKKPQS